MARLASEEAQGLVLAGERNWKVLDLVALQGMLAHRSGSWFDRMRLELRRTRENPEIANAIFDGYLCPAEYMLYGQTPYAEVISLARDLQATARRSGALRAAAFASALIGEAALLSGDLELAAVELTEASELHRDLGSAGGQAHSLQRLAEVRIAEGNRIEAMNLAAAGAPAGALVDDRQASAAAHLRHDDRRGARAPSRPASSSIVPSRRSAGTMRVRSARSCFRSPPPLRAPVRATCLTRSATSTSPSDPRGCGRGRRGRRRWPRHTPQSLRRAAIPRRQPSAPCCERSSSTGPASRSTRPAAMPGPDRLLSRDLVLGGSMPVLPPSAISWLTPAERRARGRCCPGRGTTDPSRSPRP